ncbi:dTDP-glucose 4,6-dehydratase [Candidatus Omnitrophota bacterium]
MSSDRSKILVTGGAGFIGSAFVRKLTAQGYVPLVVDSLTYAADLERLAEVRENIRLYKASISDAKGFEKIIKKENVSCIINFAAETHVDRSIKDSLPFLQTNILGVHTLLQLARKYQIPKVIHISTDEVYGEIKEGAFDEDSPLAASSPYAASKASADLLIRSHIRTYGLPAIIVRPSNNYGPWQYPEKFIPFALLRLMKGKSLPVYGEGKNIREWLYVDDCAQGIFDVFTQGQSGEIYNLGGSEEKANIEVAQTLLDAMGMPMDTVEFVKDRPGHDLRYRLNSRKIAEQIGFKPRITLVEGLRRTVDWCLEHKDWMLSKYDQINKLYGYK